MSVSQLISFEVKLLLIIFIVIIIIQESSLEIYVPFIHFLFPIHLIFVIRI